MTTEKILTNELIEEAIRKASKEPSMDNSVEVLNAILNTMMQDGSFVVPIEEPKNVEDGFVLRQLELEDGNHVLVAFTNNKEVEKGAKSHTATFFIRDFLEGLKKFDQVQGVIINPWSESFYLPKEWVDIIFDGAGEPVAESRILFDIGDITKLEVEAIVNAANKTLLGGGGVDGAIHRAAGKELLEECKTLGGCETGQAKMTKGYNLKAKYVIHTVGPVYSGKPEDGDLLSDCYWNSLELARLEGIHSIAFPAISTGVYGYPGEEAAAIALTTINTWMDVNEDYPMTVVMSCFSEKTYECYQKFINSDMIIED